MTLLVLKKKFSRGICIHVCFAGLIICNSDCLLSAEWVSSNKIVARSGPGKSKGDIVIITKSGGKGSCTVQFRGYHETIGPLKESAVWVDESHLTGLGRHRALIPSSYQQDDPLGLSVENAVLVSFLQLSLLCVIN